MESGSTEPSDAALEQPAGEAPVDAPAHAPAPVPAAPPAPPPYIPPPAYAPPAPYVPPPAYAPPSAYVPPPAYAPPPFVQPYAAPAKKRRGRGWLIVVLIVVLVLAALGGGAAYANASLSSQYNAPRAVTDYFAAQARGDVNGVMSNATYLRGDGSFAQFFDMNAITQMLTLSQNKDIKGVKVVSTRVVDDSNSSVTVSMTWAGTSRTHTYNVIKDTSRVHDYFYYSWRIQIPSATVTVTLPNQPGAVELDGLGLPSGSTANSVQTIEGFHEVTMVGTDFYDQASQMASAVDSNPSVTFPSKLTTGLSAPAATSIKTAFATCDPKQYNDCLNHKYAVPAGFFEHFTGLPGGAIDIYSNWSFAFTNDPTTGMTLVVPLDAGKLTASGNCAITFTVDGTKHYHYAGSWTATLTYGGGTFSADLTFDCTTSKV